MKKTSELKAYPESSNNWTDLCNFLKSLQTTCSNNWTKYLKPQHIGSNNWTSNRSCGSSWSEPEYGYWAWVWVLSVSMGTECELGMCTWCSLWVSWRLQAIVRENKKTDHQTHMYRKWTGVHNVNSPGVHNVNAQVFTMLTLRSSWNKLSHAISVKSEG